MLRRTFLRITTLSALLTGSSISELLHRTSCRFSSQKLGFTFVFPETWNVMTALDEMGQHLTEWGGLSDEYAPPLIMLSKFREPTMEPNFEFQVYSCEFSDRSVAGIDFDTATTFFKFLCSQRDDVFELIIGTDRSLCPLAEFAASWRTKGPNGKHDFVGNFYLLSAGIQPLLLVTCRPRYKEGKELDAILKSFRRFAQ